MVASPPVTEAWMSREDAGFRSFIRNILETEKSSDKNKRAGAVELQKHQLVVRKFLHGSPYRGLLVFHGLGSGKTCAAVSAAEALATNRPRVFVVLPASLQSNFEAEIGKCANDLGLDESSIVFVRMNGIRTTTSKSGKGINIREMTIDGHSVHGSVIVVDEVHNLAGYKKNGGIRGEALYHVIHNARDAKVICLSGTVVVNDPFELAILLNMISGPQRSLVFRNPTAKSDVVRAVLDEDPRVADHRVDGTSVKVRPVPEGYRRKDKHSYLIVRTDIELDAKPFDLFKRYIKKTIGASSVKLIEETVFPETEEEFNNRFVDDSTLGISNRTMFQMAALGTVSHFNLTQAEARFKGFPDILPERRIVLDMTNTMFERYFEQRATEIAIARSNAKRAKRTGEDEKGNFRSGTRMLCNFAFEKKGVRPFKTSLRREGDDEDASSLSGGNAPDFAYERKLKEALNVLRENNMAALKGERLREQSPKMAAIIDRLADANGPALVYSNFRTMEGVGIFAMALEAAGYTRLEMNGDSVSPATDPKKGVFHEFAGASENPAALQVFNGENKAWNKRRGDRPPVDVILITGAGAEGISLRGVRQVHIMEPFWNEVRIQQVIGRAARLGSHGHLPADERNVTVFRYVMRFADGGQREDQLIRRYDRNETTDQYIDKLSARKATLAESFLSALKSVAVDCGMYPDSVTCFGSDTDQKKRRKLRVIEENGVMLIVDDIAGKRYSYEAYKRDRKLVEKK